MGGSDTGSGGGRDPFGPVRWDLVPGRTAVVLIDLQRDFLHPDGWYAQSGVDIGHMRRVIEPTHELVARRTGGRRPADLDAPRLPRRRGRRPVLRAAAVPRRGRPAPGHLGLRPARRARRPRRGLDRREEPPQRLLQHQARARAARAEGGDRAGHGRPHQPVRRRHLARTRCSATSRPIVVEECTGTTLPHLHEPALEMMRVGWCEVRALRRRRRRAGGDRRRRGCAREVRRPLPAGGPAGLPGVGARGRRGRLRPRLAGRRPDAVAGRLRLHDARPRGDGAAGLRRRGHQPADPPPVGDGVRQRHARRPPPRSRACSASAAATTPCARWA